MPSITIEPLREQHLPDAAALVARRYTSLRRGVPQLPGRYEDPAELLPRLRNLAALGPGAVALHGGRLVGFLSGYLLDNFRGMPCAFSPEWANAAEPDASRALYEALYAHMCRLWVADGRLAHVVSLFADDAAAGEGWRWLGFGLSAADAVRDLGPPAGAGAVGDLGPPAGAGTERDLGPPAGAGLTITRAGPHDLAPLALLELGLHRHLVDAPICLPLAEPEGHAELAADLADPAYAFWAAWDGDEAVGLLKLGPATLNACAVIVDPGTTSITGAYTAPAWRGRGVGAALLTRGLAWAREAGYSRCSVDFEPMNTLAARFWLRSFQLVCLTQMRQICM